MGSRGFANSIPRFLAFAAMPWIAAALLSSCTNNLLKSSFGVGVITLPSSSNLSHTSFVILQGVPSNKNPAQYLDLVGDGSNAIGQYCQANSSGTLASLGIPSTTTCVCIFSYSLGSSPASTQTGTVYSDLNTVRCDYSQVPTSVTSMTIRVQDTSSGGASNLLTYTFASRQSVLDTSNATSFAQVKRYQCKDAVTLQYPFPGTALYDPIQSESPYLSYPLDYYTTNIANSLALYSSPANPISGWICPTNPESPSAVFGANMTIYSMAGGGDKIYPDISAFDRSTFFVATASTGVFNIPLNAYVAPQLISAQANIGSGSSPGPLGYGASPIPGATSGTETCPPSSTVTIPAGYQWAKLWLFRADLPARVFKYSTNFAAATLTCDPGKFGEASDGTGGGTYVYPNCSGNNNTGRLSTGGAADTPLFNRVIGPSPSNNLVCVDMNSARAPCASSGPGCATGQSGLRGDLYLQSLSSGTDVWSPLGGSPSTIDPFSINAVAGNGVPNDVSPLSAVLNLSPSNPGGDTNRTDFLFVVTPVSVQSGVMKDPSNAARNAYVPWRYKAAVPADTTPGNTISTYGIKWHDVGSNGDPPASDPNRPGIFPMCVLHQ